MPNGDTSHVLFETCIIAGKENVRTARALIQLGGCIIATVRDCSLAWARKGVEGKSEKASLGYSNAVTVQGCTFNSFAVAGICNPGEGWIIHGNTFEGLDHGAGATPYGIYDDFSEPSFANGVSVVGNWFGDVSVGSLSWISTLKAQFLGWTISGNIFNDGTALDLPIAAQGLSFTGNSVVFYNYPNPAVGNIDLRMAPHAGIVISGNYFQVQGNGPAVRNGENSTDLVIQGNNAR